MEEHEVKILDVNEEEIILKLEQLNAKKVFDGDLNSSYFEVKQGEAANRFIRVRQKEDKTFLTLKILKENQEMQINSEHEVEISDFETARKILSLIDLNEFSTDIRKRKSYKLKNGTVEINKYENVPSFIEVEAESPADLRQIVASLGFKMENTKAWSGKEVLNYYKNK